MKQGAPLIEDRLGRAERCAWCGEKATTEIELESAQYTHRKGPDGKKIKLIKRAALMVPVCADHQSSLERAGQ